MERKQQTSQLLIIMNYRNKHECLQCSCCKHHLYVHHYTSHTKHTFTNEVSVRIKEFDIQFNDGQIPCPDPSMSLFICVKF